MKPTALIFYSTPLFRDLAAALLSAWGMRTTCLPLFAEPDGDGSVPWARTAFVEIRSGDPRLSDRMDAVERMIRSMREAGTEASRVYSLDVLADKIVEYPRRKARSLPALEAAVRATAGEN
jgi:hypothetical protein